MIPDFVIDRILDLDIVRVIEGEGIQLKKAGADYVCCCPFHSEKTPSFHVSPTRNSWHCFGKCDTGGNAIGFVMKYRNMQFAEAVEHLANRNHIDYEKREPTMEEREARFRRENMIRINQDAQAYFRSNLNAPAAKEYIAKRDWNKDMVDEFGIGYAPGNWSGLIDFLKAKKWSEKDMVDAGLVGKSEESGKTWDFFRERLIFPLLSRTGIIVGFSGRDVTGAAQQKYINTRDTELFHKKEMLFGWSNAQRIISSTEQVILCEGNPDVIRLHQIGRGFAVAPCGTSLTVEQIREIKKKVRKVIIIGDTDAAGVRATLKHGVQLLEEGLNVRVMELPAGKDPDEYFSMHAHDFDECLARETHDYIPWMAAMEMQEKQSQTEIAESIAKICDILALCTDAGAVEIYLDQFIKKWKNGSLWKKTYFKAKNLRERKSAKDEKTEDMLAEYGFYCKGNCYYGGGSNSVDKRWSNFILVPIIHVRDEKNAKRIFQIKNNKGNEAVIKFAQSELVSFADFKTRIETAGNYVWEVSANELTCLKKYLYNDTPSADEITQLGWQKRAGFYAWGNGGLDGDRFIPADKYGIVKIGDKHYYLPGCGADTRDNLSGYQFQRKFQFSEKTNDVTLEQFAMQMIMVFGNNAKIGLCFLIATLFKDIVTSVTTSFPILNLFGPKGTGKSEMGHALTSFFIANAIAPNINNTTKAALAEAVAEVSNGIVHLDEYKNNLDLEKREFLKGLWDGAGRSRMNMDNDKRRETTAVDCGIVMSGQEMPTADIALFNRLIFLQFSKTEFSDSEKRNFENLLLVEKRGLTHLTKQILMLRSHFKTNFRMAWDTTMADLNNLTRNEGIEDRTLRNWATALAAFKAVEGKISLPFNYQEMLAICAKGVTDQNAKTKQSNELSGFWNILDSLVTGSKIWIDVDYKIKRGDMPVAIIGSSNKKELNRNTPYLYLNFSRISMLYAKESKETGEKSIPRDTLKYYLEHSAEYEGTAKAIRFRQIDNPSGFINSRDVKSKVTTAMIFNYEKIKEHYNIDIEVDRTPAELDQLNELSQANAPVVDSTDLLNFEPFPAPGIDDLPPDM